MAGSDRRTGQRRRVLKSGIIAFNERFSALPCAVRDLSDSGARLQVEGTVVVPDTFLLVVELDGLEADCQVAWRKGKEIGARFLSPPRMTTPRRRQVVKALVPEKARTHRRGHGRND